MSAVYPGPLHGLAGAAVHGHLLQEIRKGCGTKTAAGAGCPDTVHVKESLSTCSDRKAGTQATVVNIRLISENGSLKGPVSKI